VTGGNKGKGRLTSVTEESGSSTLKYDAQGRLSQDTKVIQGQSYAVAYGYDANGKVTQITLPSGRIITYTRAIDGLVSTVTTKPTSTGTVQNIATSVAYQPFGPIKGLTYGNGLALARTYDQNYWLTGTKVSATAATRLDLTFDRNANGQLAGVTDNAATGRSASFGYYDAGRLQYGVGPWGDHSYAYDAAGNRTDFRTDTGGVVAYQFAVNSGTTNQVTQVQDTNGTALRNLIYRDGGDLYEDARVGGSTYQYYYNARKRLVVANKDAVDAAYYGYDFRNQRVWRQVLSPTYAATHYIYDQQGHLLAEHNGDTGAVIKQYIWLDDTPLAVIDKSSGTEVVYYIHTGQIDEPLVMTNASKAKVWDAYVEPFGRAQVFGTASANIDLRLPGQWAQLESGGLSQNWNRDYDPTLARYIQADPIGLDGGQNLYAYVDGNPLDLIDIAGLEPMQFKFYGNWGGPGWANGQKRPESGPLPKAGDKDYNPPIDAQDACYEQHDYCINRAINPPVRHCVNPNAPKPKYNPIQVCDHRLSDCLIAMPKNGKTLQSKAASWGFQSLIPNNVHNKFP
jgi:RHS repeat-associated protein